MANRLAEEMSPYLQQHAQNPVDWYPWGEEALSRARTEDKPIFLSIGYSACHWCHVMEHESFEDPQIAASLNERFICIKVDREERPDLDHIYMTAVQIMTGRGGWPMSVFLTPDLQPFFGGTYWPPHARMGMPGFDQVIHAVHDAWTNRRDQARLQAQNLTERIEAVAQHDQSETAIRSGLLDNATLYLQRTFDAQHGGFGSAPKFPHSMDLQLLLRVWQRTKSPELHQVVKLSLDKMAYGGIYDHLGGGFARYSVDERWLVPHFEKMLYDNALLSAAYLDSYLATSEEEHRRIVCETLDYVLRDMTDSGGGFYSTEDADSEGEEGKFYLWTPQEIETVLGREMAERFCKVYDVTDRGNFEGRNILNCSGSLHEIAERHGWSASELTEQMRESRDALLRARAQRVPPGKDDKVIVSWNGLMIESFARAGRALQRDDYVQAAVHAADFLQRELWRQGRLLHCWRHGRAALDAYLDDYATLANSLISLFEATWDARWIDWAMELIEVVLARFADPSGGAFFFTADDHEALITRTKDLQDSSVPSGNAMLANALVRLAHLTQRTDLREAALGIFESAGGLLEKAPAAAGQMLLAVDLYLGPTHEIVLVGRKHSHEMQAARRDLDRRYLPRTVVVGYDPGSSTAVSSHLAQLLEGRITTDRDMTGYVCHDFTCWEPAASAAEARQLWERVASQMEARP